MANKKTQQEKFIQARVLGGFTLDGIDYKSDDIIEAHPKIIQTLGTSIDASQEAVDHCLNKKGSVIKRHEWTEPETEVSAEESAETPAEVQ